MNAASNAVETHPHYSELLRASFDVLTSPPDPAERYRLEDDAIVLLSSLLAVEEHAAPRAVSDDDKEGAQELARIERKLDLVLELLAMRTFDASAPAERPVQLSATGARWPLAIAVPAAGSIGIASIYVHRLLPRALRLPAEVLTDSDGWLSLRFLEVGERCQDLLVRHVFQQHRRRLAGTRRAQRIAA